MLPLESRTIWVSGPASVIWEEITFGAVNVAPPSLERLKATSKLLKPSTQTTLMLPAESTATWGPKEGLVDNAIGAENVTPPSLDRLKKMMLGTTLGDTTHATLILSSESTVMYG